MSCKCSFIVSAYDRQDHLACLLYSLKVQTERDWEVIVTDNSPDAINLWVAQELAEEDSRFGYLSTKRADCYEAANRAVESATGQYLCFPSDDGYYTPQFLEVMYAAGEGADLVYCDAVYGGNGCPYPCLLDAAPVAGRIDKGGFLLKRELFPGFQGPFGVDRAADAWLIERIAQTPGARVVKAPGILWVHN